ncbi:MAG: hypothetical protein IJU53_04025 [Thermoguttaceae bacterium]|nr:hypothetical protein [Thermoguttaceae bacterium]
MTAMTYGDLTTYGNLGTYELNADSGGSTPDSGGTDCPWTSANVTTILDALTTIQSTLNAIKAKTDNLPASPAATGDAMTLSSTYDAAKNAASASDVSALQTTANNIKAKTDNLPASPAAVGSAMTLTNAYDAAKSAAPAGAAMTLTSAYDKAKTAAQPGDAMTLTSAYDAAKNAAPSTTVIALLNKIHSLLGSWEINGLTLTTSHGNYALTRNNDGEIVEITPVEV